MGRTNTLGYMKNIVIKVNKKDDLVNYLINNSDYTRNKIKTLFKYKKILVNNHIVNKLPCIVNINDSICINLDKDIKTPFSIIYEDENILVVDKKAGLLTIGTNKFDTNTLYRQVRDYCNNKKNHIFIVNRIDKETSGIVMFAKSEKIKNAYQNNWNDIVTNRSYVALVEGKISSDGRIDNLLYEEKNTFVHSSKIGKRAITNYKVLKSNSKYSLLDINIETGRKNQIRVHMSELGYPIVGDKKYGSKIDPINRMCLHAYKLELINPLNGKKMVFKIDNKLFDKLVK